MLKFMMPAISIDNFFNYPLIGLLLLFNMPGNSLHAQDLDIQIRFSKHNSVYIFLEQLSSGTSNDLRSIYEQSKFNTLENEKLLQEFSGLDLYYSHRQFKSTRQFKSVCIKNDSWEKIMEQAIGLFPDKTLFKLIEVLRYFEPIYDSIIYIPNQEKFQEQLSAIQQQVQSKGLTKLFYQSMKFYGSSWNNEIPLIVTFYPIPNAEGFKAKTYGNTVTSGIPTTYKDFDMLLSVIIHEVCHLLFQSQNDKIANIINDAFTSSSSITSRYAQLLFDEAAATAIGNGLVYQQLTGKLDEQAWYYHKYIDQMAKAMYQLIEKYFDEGATIDEEFIKEYINIYDTKFTSWLGELSNLMTYSSIMASNENYIELLQSKFRYNNIVEWIYPISKESLQEWNQNATTKVLLVTEKNKETLETLMTVFPEIPTKLMPEKDFIFTGILANKTQLVVINAKNTPIEKLIDNCVDLKNFGTKFKIRYW